MEDSPLKKFSSFFFTFSLEIFSIPCSYSIWNPILLEGFNGIVLEEMWMDLRPF